MTEIQERVCIVVSSIMNVPVESVTPKSSAATIEAWDSLKHMSLIMALEQEFNVMFDDEQLIELITVEKIVTQLTGMVRV